MAAKRTLGKVKSTRKSYDLEKLLRDFKEDPEHWAEHWALWREFEALHQISEGYLNDSFDMRYDIRMAALESIGTDPILSAMDLPVRDATQILEKHPLLPVWHDIGDRRFLNIVYHFTAASLENTILDAPTGDDRDRAIKIGYEIIYKIAPDLQGQDLQGQHVDRDDMVTLCQRGHAPTLANLTERIFLECNVPEEARYGHLYRHVFPEPP